MKKYISLLVVITLFISSCDYKNQQHAVIKKMGTNWLDSIIQRSDSFYKKNYYRTDLVTAEYYISKRDSTVCQVMKDSLQKIRKVVLSTNSIIKHSSEYYANGQIMTTINFDNKSMLTGRAVTYYENGNIKTLGTYIGGIKTGEWKEFDLNGDATTIRYDSAGIAVSR